MVAIFTITFYVFITYSIKQITQKPQISLKSKFANTRRVKSFDSSAVQLYQREVWQLATLKLVSSLLAYGD